MKIINKSLFTALACCAFYFNASAQQNTVTAGGDASGTGGSASYSIGQVDYVTASGTGGVATQGVQQPYEIYQTVGIKTADIKLELSAYPNPATDLLNLLFKNKPADLHYELLNAEGKLLKEEHIDAELTAIHVEELSNGTYYLDVLAKNNTVIATFKVIKTK